MAISAGRVEAISESGADDTDLVLIHDAARPAVPSVDIDQVIKAAMREPYGAILATPVADTLKSSYQKITPTEEDRLIPYAKCTIDRSNIWQSPNPQVFRFRVS